MPNPIKYNSSTETNALNVGNFWIGTGDVDKGPTSTTGYYNGITPPPNGYTIYVHKLSQGPSIRIASDDSELIEITNHIAGTSYTTIIECFNYFEGQSDKMVTHQTMNFRITDGLVLDLDGNNIPSYPHNGTTWHDLSSSNKNGVLTNGPTFNPNGYFDFDGTDDIVDLGSSATSLVQGKEKVSMGLLFKLDALGSLRGLIGTLNYGCSQNLGLTANSTALTFYNDTATCYSVGVGGVETGKWIYGVGTYDGTTTRVYIIKDGVLNQGSASGTKSGPTNTFSSAFRVMGPNHSYRTNGQCANAFVYDKTLSESEILQNYYQAPIVTDGLVFAVDAGNLVSYENGDTTTYSLTGSSTGTLTNGVAFNSGYGGVWEFDGTDDYITLPSSIATALNGGTEASVCIWIKLTNQSNGVGDTGIIQLSGFNNSNGNLYFYANGYTYLDIFRTDRVSQVFANSSVTATDWHMLTITTTPGTNGWKCYINTKLKKQVTGQSTVSVNSTIQGGLTLGENSGGRYTNGNIASCFIYDKALTADEVSKNYHATKYKFGHI